MQRFHACVRHEADGKWAEALNQDNRVVWTAPVHGTENAALAAAEVARMLNGIQQLTARNRILKRIIAATWVVLIPALVRVFGIL